MEKLKNLGSLKDDLLAFCMSPKKTGRFENIPQLNN